MLVYILKSVACLAILFLFYKVFLEKENMHVFKRFYLLGSLLLAFSIPALVFTEYVEAAPASEMVVAIEQTTTNSNNAIHIPQALEADVMDMAPILWTVYFIGVFFFGLKFLGNLFQILRRIQRNPKHKLNRITQVLLKEKIAPHTFFSYIFLNKTKLESNEIPTEVLLHEETHAQQKHSYDVVLVEFLQVLFWVNPLVYFFKKAIKLNHEFLADQAVLKKDIDKATYQNTLLSYLSPDSEKKYQPKLANAINYSSIKKRFTVMKTHTSKKAIYLRTLLLLPLMAVLLYGFSETKLIETAPILSDQVIQESFENQIDLTENIQININKKGQLLVQDELVALDDLKNFLSKINAHLSTEQKQKVVRSFIYVAAETPKGTIEAVEEILTEYGAATIDIVGTTDNINQKGATREQVFQFNTLAKKYNKQPRASRIVTAKDLRVLEGIYGKMSKKQKANAQPFPECPPMDKPLQDGASRKLMAEYNKLAKYYNDMPRNKMNIKKKDVDRLEHIHSLMSEKQKADAEPFPDFPPMPSPPKAPKAPKATKTLKTPKAPKEPKVKKGKKSDIPPPSSPPNDKVREERTELLKEAKLREREVLAERQESKLIVQEVALAQKETLMAQEESKMIEQKVRIIEQQAKLEEIEAETERVSHIKRVVESKIPEPPTPPKPIEPVDYIIEMAKNDAKFYFEGKAISSDKAVVLVKNNGEINIDSRKSNGKEYIVRLSTEPIVIGN